MGYRLRLGRIPKGMRTVIKGLSYKEITEKFKIDSPVYELPKYKELLDLGKNVDFSKGCATDFFSFDIKEYDSEFHIFKKEGLELIIKEYHKETGGWFKELRSGVEELFKVIDSGSIKDINNDIHQKTMGAVYNFFRMREFEWNEHRPYDLSDGETKSTIANLDSYQYAIFNLVHIYKTFDWENDYLIYSGW